MKKLISAIIIIAIFIAIVIFHIIRFVNTARPPVKSSLPPKDKIAIDEALHQQPPENPYLERYR